MCSQCGSLWSKVEHRNRLAPGKACSNSIKKAMRTVENNNRLPKHRISLIRKCTRKKMNKIIIKCSECLKNTEMICIKPKRQKSKTKKNLNDFEPPKFDKKKKRRSKDKTAGLNTSLSNSAYIASLSGTENLGVCHQSSPVLRKSKTETGKQMTPLEKLKKINKNKLNNILKDDSEKKGNSLNNFLKELY